MSKRRAETVVGTGTAVVAGVRAEPEPDCVRYCRDNLGGAGTWMDLRDVDRIATALAFTHYGHVVVLPFTFRGARRRLSTDDSQVGCTPSYQISHIA